VKFREHTDTWFDKLAVERATGERQRNKLLRTVRRSPVASNLAQAKIDASALPESQGRTEILAHIEALQNNSFRPEFGRKFHRSPRFAGQVSACGELFSMLRQALEYHSNV
jgi:hypothetical protein